MAVNKGGRPTVMTPETIARLEAEFSYGLSDREACFMVGIAPSTLYEYCKENPKFSERKEALKNSPDIAAEKLIVDKIHEGDEKLAQWRLERTKKDKYSTKTTTENTHAIKTWEDIIDEETDYSEDEFSDILPECIKDQD